MAAGVKFDMVMKLPHLQNLIKRDPSGYHEEFLLQHRHYQSELKIFQLQPGKESDDFGTIVTFLSQVSSCYPTDLKTFPDELMLLLERNYSILQPKLRLSLVQALILMRNRGLVDIIPLCTLFFILFRCEDKKLRELLFSHIVNDIKNVNKGSKNEKVNKKLQTLMFTLLNDEHEVVSKKAIDIVVELYRRKIWTDARTVNVIAEACLSKNSKVMVAGVHFFLGIEEKMAEDTQAARKDKTLADEPSFAHAHSKKTRARARHVDKMKRKNKKALDKKAEAALMFPALQLINDPQGFSEKLFKKLRSSAERFEVKLLIMNLISRLIGFHKLLLLSYYPFVQKYLNSHQQHVPQILAYLVQSCHDLVPPDELQPLIQTISNNFITDRNRDEIIALGINSVREMFTRVPLILESENIDFLISDLVAYSKAKDKGVMMASRGLLNFIREVHPALLKAKQRGKYHDISARPKSYGELDARDAIDGTDLLEEAERKGVFDHEENEDPWVVTSSDEEEDDGDSEGWVDVSDDGDEDEQDEGEAESGDDESVIALGSSDGEEESDEEMEEEDDEADQDEADADADAKTSPKPKSKKAVKFAEESAEPTNPRDRLEARRILTPKDFERIKMLKEMAEKEKKDPKNRRKRAREDEKHDVQDTHVVDPNSLEGIQKKRRLTLEERLASIIKGREEWNPNKNKSGGTTNREKERKKNYLMVRKGNMNVKDKLKRSARMLQRMKNKQVKKVLKNEKKKKRRRV